MFTGAKCCPSLNGNGHHLDYTLEGISSSSLSTWGHNHTTECEDISAELTFSPMTLIQCRFLRLPVVGVLPFISLSWNFSQFTMILSLTTPLLRKFSNTKRSRGFTRSKSSATHTPCPHSLHDARYPPAYRSLQFYGRYCDGDWRCSDVCLHSSRMRRCVDAGCTLTNLS